MTTFADTDWGNLLSPIIYAAAAMIWAGVAWLKMRTAKEALKVSKEAAVEAKAAGDKAVTAVAATNRKLDTLQKTTDTLQKTTNGNNAALRNQVAELQDKAQVAAEHAAKLSAFYAAADAHAAATQGRLGIVWMGLLRRGVVEAFRTGAALAPAGGIPENVSCEGLVLSDSARIAYDPIAPALREFYRKKDGTITEEQLAEQIEVAFGPWLTRHVCAVIGVNEMACLAMAIAVAKGSPEKESPRS